MISLRSGLIGLAIVAGGPAAAETFRAINDRPFMDFVREIEGPDGYNDVVLGATSQPPKPLVTMTVREVLDYQEKLQLEGSGSTAMGQYQVIRKTLNDFLERDEVDENDLFDKFTQDRLARILMNRCGFYDPERDEDRLGNCLARAWAALPVLSGDMEGKSHYDKLGTNKALTTTDEVRAALRTRFDARPVMVAAASAQLPKITNREEVKFADQIPLSP